MVRATPRSHVQRPVDSDEGIQRTKDGSKGSFRKDLDEARESGSWGFACHSSSGRGSSMGTSSPRVGVRVEKAMISREGITALHDMDDDWVNGLWVHWLVFFFLVFS